MTNPFEILIGLDISENEHIELNKKISKLKTKLNPISVEINVSKANIQEMRKKITEGLSDSPVKVKITADSKELDELSKKASKAGASVNKGLNEGSKGAKTLSQSIKAVGKDLGSFDGNAAQAKEAIRKQMTDAKRQFAFSISEIERDLKSKKLSYTIEQKINADTREIDQVVVKVKEAANKIRQIKFEPFSAMASGTNRGVSGWMATDIKTINTEQKDLANNISKTRRALLEAKDAGNLTTEQFNKLNNSLNNITTNTALDKLNRGLKDLTSNERIANNEVDRGTKLHNMREKALADLTAAYKRYSKHIDKEGLVNLQGQYKALVFDPSSARSAKEGEHAIQRLNTQLKQYISNATVASRDSLTIMDSFKIAMERFPIWMAASTAFYGTIRTAREFMSIIIDIDTKMTDLAKVMSEDTNFEVLFDRATESAERFGQSISQVLDSYTEFARQGYKGDELGTLADAGLVASNVGDITAQRASEYMTASLIQWKKDASEAMGIIDSWNEISNSYATTTEKLAQGQARAGATARAMGLDFNQLNAIIGTVTASTKQSGNEVGNFVKATLPRLVGQPAQDALKSLNVSLTDDEGNLRDVIQVYTEVAERVKGIADSERIAVVEGLAGKFHISRMQALLDDLGQADSLYRQMYESSVDSAGSAMTENERYMKSIQARINLARVEVEKLALALGEAFLTETMIQAIQGFGKFLSVATKAVETVGALPIVFGLLGVALFGVSSRFRTLTTALITGTSNMGATRLATIGLTTEMTRAKVATATLSTSLTTLGIATGIGAGLAVLGFALEGFMRSAEKTRQLKEDMRLENEHLAESYRNNSGLITKLTQEYSSLEAQMNNPSGEVAAETSQRYYEVQNELAELMPDLVRAEDEYGNKLLGNSSTINSRILLVEKQIKAEQDLLEIQKEKEAKEKKEIAEKTLNERKDDASVMLSQFKSQANNGWGSDIYDYKGAIKDQSDMLAAIEHFENQKAIYEQKGMEGTAKKLGKISEKLQDTMALYNTFSGEAASAQQYLANETVSSTEKIINKNKSLDESTKKLATGMLLDFAAMSDSAKDAEMISDVFANMDFQKSLKSLDTEIKKVGNATSENFQSQLQSFNAYSAAFKESTIMQAQDTNGKKLSEAQIKSLSKAFDSYTQRVIAHSSKVQELMKMEGITQSEAEARLSMVDFSDTAREESLDQIEEYIDKLKELSSAAEQVVGVSEKQVNAVDDLIYTYNTLNSLTDLSATQTDQLANANIMLSKIYPDLVKGGKLRIDKIMEENEAQKILLNSVKLAKDGKLTAEDEMTLSSALGTKARIDNIKKELEAMLVLFQQYMDEAQRLSNSHQGIEADLDAEEAYIKAQKARNFEMNKTPYKEAAAKLDAYIGELNTATGALKSSAAYEEAYTKSAKESKAEKEKNIYITDKYKQALEQLNYEIKKQQELQSKFPDYTKQYKNAVQAEIKLQEQKKKLIEDQAAALEKQIKSGKILATGSVSATSTTTQKINGFGGKMTSGYGNRKDPITGQTKFHAGMDFTGSKGSKIDAVVGGKVVYAGKGTGKSAGFGNYVTIQAEDGMKHIYAHLDKVVATLGQTITAGMQVGTMGSTGRSTGTHLHYQVNNAKGQSINPSKYVQSAKSGVTTTSGAVANTQQAIDEAKSELLKLRTDALDAQKTIEELEVKLITSQISTYENERKQYQHTLDFETAKQAAISKTGKEYRASIDKQVSAMQGQQTSNQNELKYLEDLIKNGKLSGNTMIEMKDRVKALKTEMLQLGTAIEDANFEKIQSRMTAFDESQDDLQYIIDLSTEYMGTLAEGSEEYKRAANEQIAAMQKQQRMIRTQINEHQTDLLTKKLGVQATKDLKEKIEDLSISYYSLGGSIKSATESLEEANKKMGEEVADKLIESYKNVMEERKKAHLKTIEEEMKAEEKRHNQVQKNYDKELETYKKIVQAKLDSLEEEESERDYDKEIDELEAEKLKILNKINLLSMDDSFEAQKEKAELEEKLAETEETIAEKRHKREVELRKKNLQDMIEDKEEEVKQKKELEDERFEHQKEIIEKQKEYWEQHYEDLINDERKFAKLKLDIAKGNFDDIEKEFGEHLAYLKESMPEIENTLDGTMQAVGKSIRLNMIDNLNEALKLLNTVRTNSNNGGGGGGAQFDSDKGAITNPAAPSSMKGKIEITKPINLWKRERGSDKMDFVRILKKGEKYNVYGYENKFGGQYDVGGNNWITNMKDHVKFTADTASALSGGMTDWTGAGVDGKGGKNMIVHPDEIINNPLDSKQLLASSSIIDSALGKLYKLFPKLNQPTINTSNTDAGISVTLQVENLYGTQKEADNFTDILHGNIKRLKGMKT